MRNDIIVGEAFIVYIQWYKYNVINKKNKHLYICPPVFNRGLIERIVDSIIMKNNMYFLRIGGFLIVSSKDVYLII